MNKAILPTPSHILHKAEQFLDRIDYEINIQYRNQNVIKQLRSRIWLDPQPGRYNNNQLSHDNSPQ